MKKIFFVTLIAFLPFIIKAQSSENENQSSDFTMIFEAGLLLGHSESYYPAPFSSHISLLKNYYNRVWVGAGTGAEIIGKTFIPLFADVRIAPFDSKPFIIYNKFGFTYCTNKNYSDATEDNYYNSIYPHTLNEYISTSGGIMNEIGVGVLMRKTEWGTSISIGYNYKKTSDKMENSYTRTYENNFHRVAFRIGYWF